MAEEKLWGTMLWGDDGRAYYTEVDISQSVTHFVPTETTDGYNVQYPFVTHNGIADYFKGSASGNFSDNQSTECYEDYNFGEHTVDGITYNNVRYMVEFIHWLHDRKTKYLQFSEDFVIPVQIMSDIQWDTEKSILVRCHLIGYKWEKNFHFTKKILIIAVQTVVAMLLLRLFSVLSAERG